jgi:hypothetical protein
MWFVGFFEYLPVFFLLFFFSHSVCLIKTRPLPYRGEEVVDSQSSDRLVCWVSNSSSSVSSMIDKHSRMQSLVATKKQQRSSGTGDEEDAVAISIPTQ